jgi:hypothetical protein
MCSINHDLKAIYIHIPKCGGLYVENILQLYYGFTTYYFTSENDTTTNDHSGFLRSRDIGFYKYYSNSKRFNSCSNMDIDKWNTYTKFTFVRNPYDRCKSANLFLNTVDLYYNEKKLNDYLEDWSLLSDIQYVHLIQSQYNHLCNNNNNEINIDYIGKFENLNEELINILSKIGVKNMKHTYHIKNNIKINSTEEKKTKILSKKYDNTINDNTINDNTINLINTIFDNDFKHFEYPIYNSYNEYLNNKIDNNNIEVTNIRLLNTYNFIDIDESTTIFNNWKKLSNHSNRINNFVVLKN